MKLKKLDNSGLTLVEMMIASFILVVAFVGVLLTFLKCMQLNEFNTNSNHAVVAAKNRMEQIKDTDFLLQVGTWNGTVFSAADLGEISGNSSGVSYVDNTLADLYEVTVSVCWRQKNGQIVGEDSDLDGVLDAGEDTNGNGMIDSPVQITTLIFDK